MDFIDKIPDLGSCLHGLFELPAGYFRSLSLYDPSRPTYLTNLPNEILALIFVTHFEWTSSTTNTPICKRLLPFQRSFSFYTIAVRSQPALNRLIPILLNNHGLGLACRRLWIHIDDGKMKPSTVKNMRILLREVKGARQVVVDTCRRFLDLIFNKALAGTFLHRMTYLRIGGAFDHQPNRQWNVASYEALGRYPALRKLDLLFSALEAPAPHGLPFDAPPPLQVPPYLANITQLHVYGKLDPYFASTFFKSMPCLESLELESNTEERIDFATAIASLPASLRQLSLTIEQCEEEEPHGELIDDSIQHLVQLETLSIHAPFFSSRLFQSLRHLPSVKHLWLGQDASDIVKHDDILNFLRPSSSPTISSLEFLTLDILGGGRIGRRTANHEVDEEGVPCLRDWRRPKWTSNFTFDGMLKIMEVGEGRGVTIEGSVITAVEVEKAWAKERSKVRDMSVLDFENIDQADYYTIFGFPDCVGADADDCPCFYCEWE